MKEPCTQTWRRKGVDYEGWTSVRRICIMPIVTWTARMFAPALSHHQSQSGIAEGRRTINTFIFQAHQVPTRAGLSRGLVGEALTNQFSPSFWQCGTLGRVVIRFVLLHSGIQGWKLTWNTSPQQVHPRHLVLTPSIPSYCRVKTKWGTLETIQTQLSYIFPLGPPSLDVRSIAIHY